MSTLSPHAPVTPPSLSPLLQLSASRQKNVAEPNQRWPQYGIRQINDGYSIHHHTCTRCHLWWIKLYINFKFGGLKYHLKRQGDITKTGEQPCRLTVSVLESVFCLGQLEGLHHNVSQHPHDEFLDVEATSLFRGCLTKALEFQHAEKARKTCLNLKCTVFSSKAKRL